MTRTPVPSASEPPARRFGREIAAARRDGADPAELTLRLTLMDASKIKRDREVAVDDISFSADGMRYMGVRVVEGGVKSSDLFAGVYEHPAPEPPPTPVKTRKKAAPKAKAPAPSLVEA